MSKNFDCKFKHYCESCKHIMEEKGEKVIACNYKCLLDHPDRDFDLFCSNCGASISVCENEELMKSTNISLVKSAIKNPNITVVCFTAPSIRASISEEFNNGVVENAQGKLNTALRLLGFDVVFDMNVAADFTVVEEAKEFVERFKAKKNLPMMTSCCPGWVNFVTKAYKEFVPNLSTCKSPQQMFGALINNYYAEVMGKKSTEYFVVSIVPCLAKRLEARTEGINTNIGYDVDAAITTTEIVAMIKEAGIDFNSLKESDFDTFFGSASGAGTIFGNTGGVMEAVLRTIGDTVEEKDIEEAMCQLVRGEEGVRKAVIEFGKHKIRVAVVSGLMNAKPLLDKIKSGDEEYDFVEVMACPGGCVGGGGQPRRNLDEIPKFTRKRAKVLYDNGDRNIKRKSHKNPSVQIVYKNYLGEIGGELAQKLLHRRY